MFIVLLIECQPGHLHCRSHSSDDGFHYCWICWLNRDEGEILQVHFCPLFVSGCDFIDTVSGFYRILPAPSPRKMRSANARIDSKDSYEDLKEDLSDIPI